MPMKLYDTKEAVPEAHRATAVETKDGKFAVAEDDDGLGEKGKEAVRKEREARKAEKERADALEKERDALKVTAEAHEKGITKEALEEIRAKEAAARKPLEDENATLKAQLRKATLDDRLEARFLKSGGKPERWAKAKKDLLTRVDLTDDGKDFVVKDEAGNVTSETLDDFLGKTYKAEAPYYYVGVNSSGSGVEESAVGGSSDGAEAARAAGKAAAEAQKKGAAENALAFK
jgi:hypothetical protein